MTDEEIRAIIDAFLNTVGTTQYIGARYVPTFGRLNEDTWQWDGGAAEYEPLVIVQWRGDSFTSRKTVPVGIDILNEEYWANTGNFNGQLAQIYARLKALENPTDYQDQLDALEESLETETQARIDGDAQSREYTDEEITATKELITAEKDARIQADTNLSNAIAQEKDEREQADVLIGNVLNGESATREAADTALSRRISFLEGIERRNVIGGFVAPTYVGDFMENLQFGCCCRRDDIMYTFSPTNYDNLGVVRMFDMAENVLLTTINDVVMGHGNSCCWDSVRRRIWIVPMKVYNQGTSVDTNEIYYTNASVAEFGSYEMPVNDFPYGVSFDPVSETVYVIFAHNDSRMHPDTITIYSMGPNASDFTLFKTIQSDRFLWNVADVLWQDFAVYDGVMIAARTDGTCYVIPLYEDEPDVSYTFRIGSIDSGGIWAYGEVEGLEFDSEGRLYNARNGNINTTNPNEHYQINCCFVTELNTAHAIEPNDALRMNQYYTLEITDGNEFRMDRWHLRSINQAMWRMDRFARISVPDGVTYRDGVVRISDHSIKLSVEGVMSIARIILDSGALYLSLDGGSATFANGSDPAINAGSNACYVYFRSIGGHLTYNTGSDFLNAGYAPVIFCCNGLDNISEIVVEGVSVTGPRMLMGNRTVYQPQS